MVFGRGGRSRQQAPCQVCDQIAVHLDRPGEMPMSDVQQVVNDARTGSLNHLIQRPVGQVRSDQDKSRTVKGDRR